MRHFICEGTVVRTVDAMDEGTVICICNDIAVVHFANRWCWRTVPVSKLVVVSYREVE